MYNTPLTQIAPLGLKKVNKIEGKRLCGVEFLIFYLCLGLHLIVLQLRDSQIASKALVSSVSLYNPLNNGIDNISSCGVGFGANQQKSCE